MPKTFQDKDQEKGDEVLRRLLKTPPKPHGAANKDALKPKRATARARKPNKKTDSQQ